MTDGPDPSAASLLPLGAPVQLGRALVQHLAESTGRRVLFLKGPVADARGVRPPRDSADVDVLVRASDLEPLIHELGRHGWRRRPWSFAHHAFVQHSVTLLHPSWPCDLDLHVWYPGFLADSDLVCEALWLRREALRWARRRSTRPTPSAVS